MRSWFRRYREARQTLGNALGLLAQGIRPSQAGSSRGAAALIQPGTTVAVLGLAYKPSSHVIEESQGVYLCKALSSSGARVVAYDPLAGDAARIELRDHAVVLDSIRDCLAQAEVVLITTPDSVFRALSAGDFEVKEGSVIVVDFWLILAPKLAHHPRIRYIAIGRGADEKANIARLARLWDGAASTGD